MEQAYSNGVINGRGAGRVNQGRRYGRNRLRVAHGAGNAPAPIPRPARAQDLDGHQPIVLEVLGEVACRHTAAAYLAQDSVARSQSSPKLLELIRGDAHPAGPTEENAKIARGRPGRPGPPGSA